MKRGKWWILGLLLAIGLLPLGCLRSTVVCTDGCNDDDAEALVDGKPVRIQRVAADIDALERHIERYGSIVPKRADVWGQARLMAHRHEFELEMQKDLPNFNDTLQGWLSRRDQAFLAGAFSLQAALGGTPASQLLGAGQSNSINTAISLAAEPHSVPSGSTGTPPITSTASTAIAPPSFSGRDASGKLSPLPISLEPSQHLSQKARYLNHLHELRRINEGDDNADSPGYALDLVRIPVSVFTGNFTRTGFGAEITFTANPHLTDDLLPTTFKNLVIRDLVDLGTVPIAHFIGAADVKELVDTIQRMDNCQKECLAEPLWEPRQLKPMLPVPRQWKPMPPVLNGGDQGALAPSGNENVKRLSATVPPGPVKSKKGASPVTSAFIAGSGGNLPLEERDARFQAMLSPGAANVPGRQRVSQLPLAPSQLIDVIGADNAARIIASVYKTVHNHTLFDDSQQKGRVAYHLDIQGVLTDELDAAYKFLSAERMLPLWNWCTRELAEAIRSRDVRYIKESRDAFDDAVDDLVPSWIEYIPDSCNASSTTQTGKDCAPTPKKPVCRYCSDTVTACLAWAIIVESALLEHRLMEDMKVVQVAKGTLHVPEGLPFHGPNPPPEARQAFKDYV
ncbi:MAG TPA: hypothetical protein VGZ47_01460, partial [Gemmataceae bacterium]|nr:hypothetical protein [Gemmataceae bacterium]